MVLASRFAPLFSRNHPDESRDPAVGLGGLLLVICYLLLIPLYPNGFSAGLL